MKKINLEAKILEEWGTSTLMVTVPKEYFDNIGRVIINDESSKMSSIFYEEDKDVYSLF